MIAKQHSVIPEKTLAVELSKFLFRATSKKNIITVSALAQMIEAGRRVKYPGTRGRRKV